MENGFKIKFYSISQNKYNEKLTNGLLQDYSLYFIKDTNRIYQGSVLYSQNIELLSTSELEEYLSQNSSQTGCSLSSQKIYIDSQQGSMYICIQKDSKNQLIEIGISNQLKQRLQYLTKIQEQNNGKIVSISEDGNYQYTKSIVNIISSLSQASDENIVTQKAVRNVIGDGASIETPILVNNKLNQQFNPISVASMQNTTGTSDFSKLKIIGDCSVIYGANGMITLRIGPALNCSLFNGTDGISSSVVSYDAKNTEIATISNDYVNTTNTGIRTIVVKGESDQFTANCGNTATTTQTKGNSVHFEGDGTCKFKVYIGSGLNATTINAYEIGPISENDMSNGSYTYYDSTKSIACKITNYKDEPKLSSGANGKCGNVNFSFIPNKLFTTTTDFKIVKIQQIEISDVQTVVATWTNDNTTVYMFMAETNVAGNPTTSSYTLTKKTKSISGVTYLTTQSTMTPSATGLTNIGYPGYNSNLLHCSTSGGNWFTSFYEQNKDNFTTWTDVKDKSMSWTGTSKNLCIGAYVTPKISVKGINMHGSSATASISESLGSIYVCDSNGYVDNNHGSISQNSRLNSNLIETDYSTVNLTNTNDLQIFNGFVVYPSINYKTYNANGSTVINPDYSQCQGTRYYYVKLNKSGTIMGGTISFTTDVNPSTYISYNKFKIELSNGNNTWMDIGKTSTNGGIGDTFTYGTSNKITFSIPNQECYGTNYMYARVTMTSTGVKLASITLS